MDFRGDHPIKLWDVEIHGSSGSTTTYSKRGLEFGHGWCEPCWASFGLRFARQGKIWVRDRCQVAQLYARTWFLSLG